MATQIEPSAYAERRNQELVAQISARLRDRAPFHDAMHDTIPFDTFVQAISDQQNNVVPTQPSLEELAIQMADWVDENVGGLSQREAEGLEAEFKRLAASLICTQPVNSASPASANAATQKS